MNRILQWFQVEPDSPNVDDRQFIRERILTVVLMGAALLGLFAYIVNVRLAIQQNVWGWVAIYTIAFSWVCAIAFVRQIAYNIRAASMLIILYALGIVSALQYGAAGDSRIWFFGAAVLAGVFMGLRVGVASILITTITYVALGWLMSTGILVAPDPSATLLPDDFEGWSSTAVPYFTISVMLVSSIGVLVNSLNNNVRRSRELAEALAKDREQLALRSEALERRELQIRTAADISRAAVAELDPDTLFQRVSDLVRQRYNLYYVGVFTVDESGHTAVLRAGTGEAGQRMLAQKHHLPINSASMIGTAIQTGEAHIASNVGLDPHHFKNPDLPHTRSELALPMISAGQILGAISVQSMTPSAFDENDIVVLQGVADSLATALENANLFQQVQKSLEEVQTLHRQYLLESWGKVTTQTKDLSYTFEKDTSTGDEAEILLDQQASQEFPLLLRDQAIGNISVESARGALSVKEQAFIEAVTQQTALALENVRLVEETQRNAQQDRVVSAISEELTLAMDVDSVIKTAVRELGQLPKVTEVSVHIEPDSQKYDV
jgi:GAF domain-containing protein